VKAIGWARGRALGGGGVKRHAERRGRGQEGGGTVGLCVGPRGWLVVGSEKGWERGGRAGRVGAGRGGAGEAEGEEVGGETAR